MPANFSILPPITPLPISPKINAIPRNLSSNTPFSPPRCSRYKCSW